MENQNNSFTIQIKIDFKVPKELVWKYLTKDINSWWPKDFYSSPKTEKFILETKVGGRMYEDFGNEEGLLWYNVIVLDSPNTLELKGHLTPDFGGPAITFFKIRIKRKRRVLPININRYGFWNGKTGK